jgi:hypothetical protein
MGLGTQIEESAIERVIGAGNERSFIRAKKKGQCRNLPGFAHSSNRLRPGENAEHFRFVAGIISSQIVVYKRSMDASR